MKSRREWGEGRASCARKAGENEGKEEHVSYRRGKRSFRSVRDSPHSLKWELPTSPADMHAYLHWRARWKMVGGASGPQRWLIKRGVVREWGRESKKVNTLACCWVVCISNFLFCFIRALVQRERIFPTLNRMRLDGYRLRHKKRHNWFFWSYY